MKLPAITRPNGAIYRPRTLTSRTLGDEDETTGVVVFGTHDVEQAAGVARLDVRAMNREIGYRDDEGERYVLEEGTARPVWWRQDLAYFDEFNQARYYYTTDEEKGRAGIRFDLTLEEGQ